MRKALAAAALASLLVPRVASACTGPLASLCAGARAVVSPSNHGVIVFQSVRTLDAAGELSWTTPVLRLRDGDGADLAFTMDADPHVAGRFLVRPSAPLVEGATYTLGWDALCSAETIAKSAAYSSDTASAKGAEVALTVPPAAPLPSTLGRVAVLGPYVQSHASGSCDANPRAFTEVAVAPQLAKDPALDPYGNLTRIWITVDGVAIDEPPWALRSTTGIGTVLIASCDPSIDTGIAPGKHRVGFVARVAGVDTPLVAETDADFDCGGPGSDPSAPADASSGEGSSCAVTAAGAGGAPGAAALLSALALAGAVTGRARRSRARR